MPRFDRFLPRLDAKLWCALLAAATVIAGISGVFVLLRWHFGLDETVITQWLQGHRAGPWGLVWSCLVFVAAAFVGVPQFLLVAACVVVFGPWWGLAYSWLGTVTAAAVTYFAGRGPAARLVDRVGSRRLDALRYLMGRNAFWASFIARNVPSAPFVVVNASFGAARAHFGGYWLGCALGSLPKIAMVSLFGGSVVTAVKGDGVWSSAILAVLAALWLGVVLLAKRGIQTHLARRKPIGTTGGDESWRKGF